MISKFEILLEAIFEKKKEDNKKRIAKSAAYGSVLGAAHGYHKGYFTDKGRAAVVSAVRKTSDKGLMGELAQKHIDSGFNTKSSRFKGAIKGAIRGTAIGAAAGATPMVYRHLKKKYEDRKKTNIFGRK